MRSCDQKVLPAKEKKSVWNVGYLKLLRRWIPLDRQETAALVKQVQNGDRTAFEKLYEQYRDRLFFFVLKNVGSREAAEDIVSESFVKALENISELRSREAFGGWLYRIAYAQCMDWLKSEGQNAHFDSDTERDSVIENSALNEPVMVPDNYVESEQVREQLKAVIDSLKPDMRSAVILYYYEEQTVAQVAKALGMNENAAKQKLFQARKKLKHKIEKLFKNGAAFCAVPLGAVLESTVEPAAIKGASGAVVSTGFIFKAAAIGAAAAVAVGVPIGLLRMENKMGDVRPESSVVEDESKNEPDISDILPNEEEMKRDLEYLDSIIYEFMYDEKLITPSDNIWYSDPIVVYYTNNGIDVYTDDSYAYIIIDKDNNEAIGIKCVSHDELDRNIALGLDECYTDSLRSGKPMALVHWYRAEGYESLLCVSDGKVVGSFGAEIPDTLDASTFDVDYTEISAVHQAAPAKQ